MRRISFAEFQERSHDPDSARVGFDIAHMDDAIHLEEIIDEIAQELVRFAG